MADEAKTEKDRREERLARALRANLKKRKQQARGRAAPAQDEGQDQGPDPDQARRYSS